MTDTKLNSDHRPCGSHAWARTWWTPRACCIFLTSKREKEREGEREGERERKRARREEGEREKERRERKREGERERERFDSISI